MPTNAAFVAALMARRGATASATDRAFPANEHVEIISNEPVLKRLRARDATDGAAFLKGPFVTALSPAAIVRREAEAADFDMVAHWIHEATVTEPA